MSDPRTIQKLKNAVEKRFSYYPKTKEVLDLKEELLSIMLDKYNDLTIGTEIQKYNECMAIMLSSYKQVLHDLEVESSRKILKDKLMGFTLFSTIYFLLAVLIYVIISQFIIKSFLKTYFIVLAPSIVFTLLVTIFMFKYCKKMKYEVMTRVSMGLCFLALAVILYTIPCFYLSIYHDIHLWHPTWLVFLAVGSIYLIVDSVVYPNKKPIGRLIRNCLILLAIFTTIYLSVSILFGYWHVTWLIFLAFILGCELNIMLFFKNQI